MRLRELLQRVAVLSLTAPPEAEVRGISTDTRRLSPGEVFVALRGEHRDGHSFAQEALRLGAPAVVVERPLRGLPCVEVADTRAALARMAANLNGNPSERLTLVGVTGTNGKTTTTCLLEAVLRAQGLRTGLIGTVGYLVNGRKRPAALTTPLAQDFQGLLAEMLRGGSTHAVVEVSSHALALRRVDATEFRAAVFTNLSRDHLDFHPGMEAYYQAKARLFRELLKGPAVINADDPYGQRLMKELQGTEVLSFGFSSSAALRAQALSLGPQGLSMEVLYQGRRWHLESPLLGRPNAYNLLAALGASLALGLEPEAAIPPLQGFQGVKGRLQSLRNGQDFLVLIDYAHSPDALRQLILKAREIAPSGRVITLFGCGGERDKGKRPLMGALAEQLSDAVVLTSDNPRGEEPEAIIRDILRGMSRPSEKLLVEPERPAAIRKAIAMARAGDVVLIAGKGHEDYQEVKGVRYRMSDYQLAAEALKDRSPC